MCLKSYANNKGADQPAHPRSLISAFVVRCLDSIISLDSTAEISRLKLVPVAVQASLCLAWSETPEDTFCRVEAQIDFITYTRLENNSDWEVAPLRSDYQLWQSLDQNEHL